MRGRDTDEAARILRVLSDYEARRPLPGIQNPACRTALLEQLLESIHRVRYISRGVLGRDIDPRRADPLSDLFDPVKAAALRARQGQHDEACWLVFIFAHFGKHLTAGYRLARDVYGALGSGGPWTWARISPDPEAFRNWLAANEITLRNDGVERPFGNHRRYLTLNAHYHSGTGAAFVSYVHWVNQHGNHAGLFAHAEDAVGRNPNDVFDFLYRSMGSVASFGRLGRFDYLTMLGKLDLACIEPGSAYLSDATGPLEGARLLFGTPAGAATPRQLDQWLAELNAEFGWEFGMQVLEDALCNWQKSPAEFIPFRG